MLRLYTHIRPNRKCCFIVLFRQQVHSAHCTHGRNENIFSCEFIALSTFVMAFVATNHWMECEIIIWRSMCADSTIPRARVCVKWYGIWCRSRFCHCNYGHFCRNPREEFSKEKQISGKSKRERERLSERVGNREGTSWRNTISKQMASNLKGQLISMRIRFQRIQMNEWNWIAIHNRIRDPLARSRNYYSDLSISHRCNAIGNRKPWREVCSVWGLRAIERGIIIESIIAK